VKRSALDVFLIAGVVGAIAWGTFAFGAVYPWAYTPLASACAIIGATALVAYRKSGPPVATLAAALTAVATGAACQLIPLPAGVFLRITPAADAFLSSYDLLCFSRWRCFWQEWFARCRRSVPRPSPGR
jgi:hypothetical protein